MDIVGSKVIGIINGSEESGLSEILFFDNNTAKATFINIDPINNNGDDGTEYSVWFNTKTGEALSDKE